jgi:hypothetical protein
MGDGFTGGASSERSEGSIGAQLPTRWSRHLKREQYSMYDGLASIASQISISRNATHPRPPYGAPYTNLY